MNFKLTYLLAVIFGVLQGAVAAPPQTGSTSPDRTSPSVSVSGQQLFRSFLPESLVTRKYERRLPAATGWRATFRNTTGQTVSTLELHFKKGVTVTSFAPFPDAVPLGDNKDWLVFGQELADGDSLTVHGIGPAERTEITSWRYVGGAFQPGFIPAGQKFYLPMPNTANLRREVFQFGGFAPGASTSDPLGGMVIGKSFLKMVNGRWRIDPDAARIHGWVRLRRQTDMLRSLQRNKYSPLHTGTPRGFAVFDNGRPFIRQVNNLTTLKMNNRLFAGLVALKANIASSALGITPPGFGELIYEDNGHPLDDRMIRDISVIADSFLTYHAGRDSTEYMMLDSIAYKINSSFSGPIDTVSFADSLVFSGVRDLGDVPYLRANTDVPTLRLPRIYQPEFDDESDADLEEEPAIPQVITLARNYPNPFNPQTIIQFELLEPAVTTMRVYDLLGREMGTLLNRELLYDGINEVVLDAGELSSGTYFYRISAESYDNSGVTSKFTGKMLLVR